MMIRLFTAKIYHEVEVDYCIGDNSDLFFIA